jgi:hypothetical protein
MISQCARATTAAEAKFRIDAPNSQPRNVKIIALDAPSERVAKHLAARAWSRASFFTASAFAPRNAHRFSPEWLTDLAGRTKNLIDEIASADLVVMIAAAGENAQAATIIGEACSVSHVMTTALILGSENTSDEALSKSLAQLRPYALMLVVANGDDDIEDMLTALRA